jgi:hypothetical protein
MGYFGGYGGGRGWHKFRFLITPDEWRQILIASGVHVVSSGRVSRDYIETGIEPYLEHYARYYAAMFGEGDLGMVARKFHGENLTATLEILELKLSAKYPEYAAVDFREPVISVSAFPLFFLGESISLSWGGHEDLSFGLELVYPKAVSFDHERYAYEYPADQFVNWPLYQSLTTAIKAITTGCKVQSPAKVHRVDVRISPAVRAVINQHPGLQKQGLVVL